MGQSIQEWTRWNLWKTAFKKFEVMWSASRPYHFKIFKGCLPQMLLGSFLNTMTQMCLTTTTIYIKLGGVFRTPQKFQMESFAVKVNGCKSLSIVSKLSILMFCWGPCYVTGVTWLFFNFKVRRQREI